MSQPVPEDTSKSAQAHAQQNPRPSFGSWLRHQREARSVSMREIADNSKISLRYLEALEQDRFDVLPAPVFARGFLREYARVVGLNPDEVVNLYLVAIEERSEGNRRVERPKPMRPESRSSSPSSLGYGLLLGLAVVLFVGIAALLSFFAERRRGTPTESKLVAPATMASRSPESAPPPPAAPLAEPPAGSEANAPPAAGVVAPENPRAADSGPAASTASAPATSGPFRVVLNFSQDCWMESVVDGNRRTSELKAGGETVQLEAFEAVVLTLGNSHALTVEVDGVPFPLPENSTRVVRDLRIERPVRPVSPPATGTAAPPARPVASPASSPNPPVSR
jgi:cytoskeleton protein RodZ